MEKKYLKPQTKVYHIATSLPLALSTGEGTTPEQNARDNSLNLFESEEDNLNTENWLNQ